MTLPPRAPLYRLTVCLLLVVAVAAFVRLRGDLGRILGTDEADYVRAIAQGTGANYLGTRERSGFTFTADVIDEYRRTGWARPFQQDWAANDAAGLRHYHPPLALYPIGLLQGTTDEGTLRLVPLVTGVLACGASALLAFVLLTGATPAVQLSLTTAAGLLTATSVYHAGGSGEIGPHAAFSLLSTSCLACASRALQTSTRGWWYGAWVAMGLTLLTVPYWALLVPALLWTWWSLRSGPRSNQSLTWGVLVALATAIAAWPPLLVSAGFVKPVLMYVGIILHPLTEVRTPGAWMVGLVQTHRALAVLGIVGVAGLVMGPRERFRAFVPAALFIGGFVLVNLRVGHMKPLYASDVLAPLAAVVSALAGWAMVRLGPRAGAAVAVATVSLVALSSLPGLAAPASRMDWRSGVRVLNDSLAGQRILVTPRAAGAIIRYYLPDSTTVLDSNDPHDLGDLRGRLGSNGIDVVLRWGGTVEPQGLGEALTSASAPEATANVGGTIVSWWRVAHPSLQR